MNQWVDISGIMIDRNFGQNLGIGFANGQIWEDNRRWVVRNLREYGWGKSKVLEASVNSEIAEFLKDFDKDGQQVMQVNHTFFNPVTSCKMSISVTRRLTSEHNNNTRFKPGTK